MPFHGTSHDNPPLLGRALGEADHLKVSIRIVLHRGCRWESSQVDLASLPIFKDQRWGFSRLPPHCGQSIELLLQGPDVCSWCNWPWIFFDLDDGPPLGLWQCHLWLRWWVWRCRWSLYHSQCPFFPANDGSVVTTTHPSRFAYCSTSMCCTA